MRIGFCLFSRCVLVRMKFYYPGKEEQAMFESDNITEFMSAFDEKLEGYPEQIEEFIASK